MQHNNKTRCCIISLNGGFVVKKKIWIGVGIILIILILTAIITNYVDSGRVTTGHEPKYCIKVVSNDGSKVTYWGLGYKVIRYVGVSPDEPYENNIGVKMGNWFMKYELEEKLDVKEINNYIISYLEDNNDTPNFVFNYVDEISNKVVVGLIDNSKEEQEKFIEKVFAGSSETKILDAINKQETIEFVESKDVFDGKIIVAEENYITVEVLEDSKSFKVKDKVTIKISRPVNGTNDYYVVNNNVRVTFSGLVQDSNPAQINAVKIELIL